MSSDCTAPKLGHGVSGARQKCPVHGKPTRPADRAIAKMPPSGMSKPLWQTATDPKESPEVLAVLAAEGKQDVRERVACNPSASRETLELLAKDPEKEVRWAVARNLRAPESVLIALAQDPDGITRGFVAQNPRAPAAALALLVDPESRMLRAWVATHANTPGDVLLELERDAALDVSVKAKKSVTKRLAVLGVKEDNKDAVALLREQAWWDMTAESSEVAVALALYPGV